MKSTRAVVPTRSRGGLSTPTALLMGTLAFGILASPAASKSRPATVLPADTDEQLRKMCRPEFEAYARELIDLRQKEAEAALKAATGPSQIVGLSQEVWQRMTIDRAQADAAKLRAQAEDIRTNGIQSSEVREYTDTADWIASRTRAGMKSGPAEIRAMLADAKRDPVQPSASESVRLCTLRGLVSLMEGQGQKH